jgi:hypothetical protein
MGCCVLLARSLTAVWRPEIPLRRFVPDSLERRTGAGRSLK